jgi:hypothetical protein
MRLNCQHGDTGLTLEERGLQWHFARSGSPPLGG